MKSSTTSDFWNSYFSLPSEIKSRAKKTYQLWKRNPRHPSLQFKKVGQIWSIRVGEGFRALAMQESNIFFWFWIGNHDEYKRLIEGRVRGKP